MVLARVLWIEDEAERSFSDYADPVIMAGHVLETTGNATDAAERLKSEAYDVVIVDIIINAGTDDVWKRLDEHPKDKRSYLGLDLIRAIFKPEFKPVQLHIPVSRLSPDKIAVLTVVEDKEIHKELRSYGITEIRVKAQSDMRVLKQLVDISVSKSLS